MAAAFKSAYTVSLMTFMSRILGFVRDVVFALMFGATLGFDAFLIAFKIPNFMRRLFAEGAFSQAFVPILSDYQSTKSKEEVKALIDKVAGCLLVVLVGVTLIGCLASPLLIALFAPGFLDEPHRFDLASSMLKITFPYLLFISLTALAGGILNTYKKFALPAFTPVLLNVCLILAATRLSPYFANPSMALAWGVLLGGMVQFSIQIPALMRQGLWPKFKVDFKDPGVRRVLTLMGPALLGASVMQINLLVDTLFASFLTVGSLSWLYYSDRLVELPLGMFGVALATVALPKLSGCFAKKDDAGFEAHLSWSLRWCLLIGIPSATALWILAKPIMATLFYRGAFTAHDLLMATKSLHMLCVGLTAFMVVKILVSAFYSRQNTKFPVKVAIVALVLNVILNAALIQPLAHAGLALASSISAWCQAAILGVVLFREGILSREGWAWFIIRLLFACALMGGALVMLMPELDVWLNWSTWHRFSMLLFLCGVGFITYFLSLILFGLRLRALAMESA